MGRLNKLEDHDLLIRVDTKVDQLSLDIKEIKDGTAQRLAVLESRVEAIEKLHNEVNPTETLKRFETVEKWVNNFQLTWKFILLIVIAVSSIITFILTTLGQLLNLFGR
jgi:hypothetical protein